MLNKIRTLNESRRLAEPQSVAALRAAMITNLKPSTDYTESHDCPLTERSVTFDAPFIPDKTTYILFGEVLRAAGYHRWHITEYPKLDVVNFKLMLYPENIMETSYVVKKYF